MESPKGSNSENDSREKIIREKNTKNKSVVNWGWVIKVFIISFTVTVVLTILSSEVLDGLNLFVAFFILLLFILIGIIFDIIGLAVTTADEKPFHSMAARKVKIGNRAVKLIKNSEKVSSFCNDVIGDIAGVVSGATGAAIVARMFTSEQTSLFGNLIVTAIVAGITVGGKAIGKSLGIKFSYDIVYLVSKMLCVFTRESGKLK